MLDVPVWTAPPVCPQFLEEEIHVWQADLTHPVPSIEAMAALLSADEQQRASRFRFERDRRKFVLCRGILRTILSRYLGRDPIALKFHYSQYGKPALADSDLSFNLAHSGDRVLYAVTAHHAIGVDVEQLRPVEYAAQIVSRYFAPIEQEDFEQLDSEQQQFAFFRGWTGKEAFLKAIGSGLSLPPNAVAVTLLTDRPPELLRVPAGYAIDQWKLYQFLPTEGYVGAIVMPQRSGRLRFFEFS